MTYLDLFLGFLKVGCFAFGGGYGAVPLIRDVVLSYGWLTEEQITYMVAISESTPGPIMVNMATYVGSTQGGILGAVLTTLAVVMPSFFIIILATGSYMLLSCLNVNAQLTVSWQPLVIAVALFAFLPLYNKLRKKKLSPIWLIVLSAVLGILVY